MEHSGTLIEKNLVAPACCEYLEEPPVENLQGLLPNVLAWFHIVITDSGKIQLGSQTQQRDTFTK